MIGNVSKNGIVFASLFVILLIAAAVFLYPAASPPTFAAANSAITTLPQPQSLATGEHANLSVVQQQPSAVTNDIESAFAKWEEEIRTSSRTKDVIARVIFSKDASNNIADLKHLLDTDPQNPLLHYLLATNCLRAVDATACKPVKQSALAIFESDNGILGDLEFVEAYKQGDLNAALAALDDASLANHTSNFYGAEFKALTESMDAAGLKHDMHMIETTIGIMAASVDSFYSDIWTACKQHGQREWQDACYNRGMSLAQNSVNDWPKAIGLQLVKATGRVDDPRYEKLVQQARSQLEESNKSLSLWELANTNNFQLDDAQWKEFLMMCQTQGETVAKHYLQELIEQGL